MTDAPANLDFNRSPLQQRGAMRGHTSVREIAARLNDRIADLACELLGEPNRALSTANQMRFGTKGSVAVEIDGPEAGMWYDHELGVGGDGLTLICHHHGLANGAACVWACNWLGLPVHTKATTAHLSAPGPDATDDQPQSKNNKNQE